MSEYKEQSIQRRDFRSIKDAPEACDHKSKKRTDKPWIVQYNFWSDLFKMRHRFAKESDAQSYADRLRRQFRCDVRVVPAK